MGEEKLAELEAMMAQGASLRCLLIWIALLKTVAIKEFLSDIMSKFMAKPPALGEGGGGESGGGGGGQQGGQGGQQGGQQGGLLAKGQEQVTNNG